MDSSAAAPKAEPLLTSVFSEALLAFLFAQTFKTALDHGLAPLADHRYWPELVRDLSSTPKPYLFEFLQLLAFLFTLCRFYAGTHRFHKEEAGRDTSLRAAVHDTAWMMFLFVAFYLAAMLVAKAGLFLLTITIVHIVDILWFLLTGTRNHAAYVNKAIGYYVKWDTLTVLFSVIAFVVFKWLQFDAMNFQWISAAILIPMFILDVFGPARDWYFNPQAWRARYE